MLTTKHLSAMPLSSSVCNVVIRGSSPVQGTQKRIALSSRNQRTWSFCVKASLDSQAAFAVSQQAAAFAAVVGAEAAFTGLSTEPTIKGRPGIAPTIGGVAGIIAAIVLVQQQVDAPGYAVGFAASAFFFANYVQRTKTTEHIPEEWPGPKAWPAVMALISFFSLAAFLQALLPALGLDN